MEISLPLAMEFILPLTIESMPPFLCEWCLFDLHNNHDFQVRNKWIFQ